jgi:peroxiredoxin Q/BCP
MVREVRNKGKVSCRGQISVKPGELLLPVTLYSTAGREVNLAAEADNNHVVLFFYPGDREGLRYPELAGCTSEACSFRNHLATLRALGAIVFGVSLQPTERQQQFVEREHLTFELLSDEKQQLVQALGIPLWISFTGDAFTSRTTIVVEKGGRLTHVFKHLNPDRHVKAAIEVLRRL